MLLLTPDNFKKGLRKQKAGQIFRRRNFPIQTEEWIGWESKPGIPQNRYTRLSQLGIEEDKNTPFFSVKSD